MANMLTQAETSDAVVKQQHFYDNIDGKPGLKKDKQLQTVVLTTLSLGNQRKPCFDRLCHF